jgi:hypothetical protein
MLQDELNRHLNGMANFLARLWLGPLFWNEESEYGCRKPMLPLIGKKHRRNFVAASEGQLLPSGVKTAADLEASFMLALSACDTSDKMREVTTAMETLARRFEHVPE